MKPKGETEKESATTCFELAKDHQGIYLSSKKLPAKGSKRRVVDVCLFFCRSSGPDTRACTLVQLLRARQLQDNPDPITTLEMCVCRSRTTQQHRFARTTKTATTARFIAHHLQLNDDVWSARDRLTFADARKRYVSQWMSSSDCVNCYF